MGALNRFVSWTEQDEALEAEPLPAAALIAIVGNQGACVRTPFLNEHSYSMEDMLPDGLLEGRRGARTEATICARRSSAMVVPILAWLCVNSSRAWRSRTNATCRRSGGWVGTCDGTLG